MTLDILFEIAKYVLPALGVFFWYRYTRGVEGKERDEELERMHRLLEILTRLKQLDMSVDDLKRLGQDLFGELTPSPASARLSEDVRGVSGDSRPGPLESPTPLGLGPGDKPPYDTKDEFLIAATVANKAHVDESFILRTSVPRDGTVADFLTLLRLQRAISKAQAQGSPRGDLRLDEAEPLELFDWSASPLPLDIPISKIAHGRVLIAIFDDEMPPAKAATITKESVEEKPEVQRLVKIHEKVEARVWPPFCS